MHRLQVVSAQTIRVWTIASVSSAMKRKRKPCCLEHGASNSCSVHLVDGNEASAVFVGGFGTDSQDPDDASVSSAVEAEEEASSPAIGRGGSLASSLKRRGLATPPATPGGSRGGECDSNTEIQKQQRMTAFSKWREDES